MPIGMSKVLYDWFYLFITRKDGFLRKLSNIHECSENVLLGGGNIGSYDRQHYNHIRVITRRVVMRADVIKHYIYIIA